MDAAALWKRIALKAALSPVVLATWAGTAGAAVWMQSPWPLPVGAGLSLAWILVGSRSARYRDAVLADVRKEREAKVAAERALAVQQVGAQLDEPPLRGWIQSGMLPDYLQIFRRLSEIRDRVARIARERAQVEAVSREEMIEQLVVEDLEVVGPLADELEIGAEHRRADRGNRTVHRNTAARHGRADGDGEGRLSPPPGPSPTSGRGVNGKENLRFAPSPARGRGPG